MTRSVLPLLFLSACGGSGDSNFFFETLPGRNFAATKNGLDLIYTTPTGTNSGEAFIRFITETQAELTINGETRTIFDLDQDSTFESIGFDSSSVIVGISLRDGPNTPDVLYFIHIGDYATRTINSIDLFTGGNETSISALSGKTSATYTGVANSIDGVTPGANGSMTLDVNFVSGATTGNITGVIAGSPGAQLDLVPTTLSGTGFDTTLTSTDVTLTDSRIVGQLYGNNANQAAGSFRYEASTGDGVGLFSLTD